MNAIYCRVSTEEQAKKGYSIPDQIAKCNQVYFSMGISEDIKEFIDDGYSGEFLERPALDELRQYNINNQLTRIVMIDPDRMARTLSHMLLLADEFERKDVKLIFDTGSYDTSPEGRLFFAMKGAVAQYEKDKIRQRTMSGRRRKALSGKLTHNDNPLGYDFDKERSMYVINEKEAETIRLIYDLYIKHSYGVRQLENELKYLGVVNKKGNPINKTQVHRILQNEMYAGIKWAFKRYDKKIGQRKTKQIKRDKKDWIGIKVPAIIDRETFQKAQETLQKKTILSKRNTKNQYLLRSIIRCGICGFAMIGQTYNLQNGKKYSYYHCTSLHENRGCCKSSRIQSQKLDDMVWNQIVNFVKKNIFFPVVKKELTGKTRSKASVQKYITELERRQSKIVSWVTSGTIKMDIAEKELEDLSKEITAAKAILNSISKKPREKKSHSFNKNDVLSADTFEKKRNIIINSGLTVVVRRIDKNIDWWFA